MDENIAKIIKCGINGSWSIVSQYESEGFHLRKCNLELRVHYIVDTTNETPTTSKKFSLARIYTEDNTLYEDLLWEGKSLQEEGIIGFTLLDLESPTTRGRISGIKIMNIYHYIPLQAFIVYRNDPGFDNEM